VAFKKAYEVDPYDLDSLLCLGISCTNELDPMQATMYLQSWLRYHPDFSTLANIQEEKADYDQLRQAYE
jgi:hypothetical protein